MERTPQWYADWRVGLGFDTIEYGGIGVQLFEPDEIPSQQLGFAVTTNGRSLVGLGPDDWRPEWVVIGQDTGCGDPIFASQEHPHPVFSAMHGQGSWNPKLVAQSLEVLGQCLNVFQRFTAGRRSRAELDGNPPGSKDQLQFLEDIRSLTNGDQEALGFWAVQIELDLDAFDWPR